MTAGFDNWIDDFQWTPDSSAIVFKAEVEGKTPLYRLDVSGGAIIKVLEHATIDQFALVNGGREAIFTSRSDGALLHRAPGMVPEFLGGGAPPWTTEQFLRNAVFDRNTGERLK